MDLTKYITYEDHRDTYAPRLVLAFIAMAVFLADLFLVTMGDPSGIDSSVGAFIHSFRGDVLSPVLNVLTHMGDAAFIVALWVVILILDLALWKKALIPGAIAGCLLDLGVYLVIKPLIGRPRPDTSTWISYAEGYSFPSGHTMNSVFCYGIMIYLVIRLIKSRPARDLLTCLLAFVICVVAFSRVFVGVHYATDVIGGFSIGLSFLLIATVALDEMVIRLGKDPGKPA